jgi:hypothetical protein
MTLFEYSLFYEQPVWRMGTSFVIGVRVHVYS